MADTENILPNDDLINNLDNFTNHLGSANNGFNDFVNHLGGMVNSVRRIDSSLIQNTAGLITGLSEISHNTRFNNRQTSQSSSVSNTPSNRSRSYDSGGLIDRSYQHPVLSSNISNTMSNIINSGVNTSLNNNAPNFIRRTSAMLDPISFAQGGAIFGAVFPAQMKMAETMIAPITQTLNAFEPLKSFSKGFTGMDSAIEGFKSQLTDPFKLYEGLYQSQAMLGSALGGEKAADNAMKTALKMARDYPIKTEEALSALTKMAVYPEVKPHLSSENFQRQLMETVSGLSLIAPEQGMSGAMFSMVEAMSGSQRSMQMRFNVSPDIIQSLSGMTTSEMSSDPTKLVEGLHRFIGKAIGLDVLEKQKYTFSKQIDNFGDSLQMVTKNVMERTGLYKTMTGAATAFQSGFSSLGENREFINYVSSIFKPYQTRVDKAVSSFMGVEVGAYKSMPMSQVMEAMEKNFSELSMEEIGSRFENLIDDMGGIQKDTTLKINDTISGKFGDVLGMIGGDIASIATSSFTGLASGIFKGVGQTIVENPVDTALVAGGLAATILTTLGTISIIPKLIESGFKRGTFSNIRSNLNNRMQGNGSSQISTVGALNAFTNIGQGTASIPQVSRNMRSNLRNLINFQNEQLNNVINTNIDIATQRVNDLNNGVTARRGSSSIKTRSNVLNAALDRAMDTSVMSRNNQQIFNQYRDKLKTSGMSSANINNLYDTLRMESIESIENENYIKSGIRRAGRKDLPMLKRELIGASYDYNMSHSTERALNYAGGKSIYGDTFKIGDEITSTMVAKLNTATKDYSKLTNVSSISELSNIKDTNALNRFARDLKINTSDILKGSVSTEQLRLLKENGKWLRESSKSSKQLLDGFMNNRFKGVSAMEKRISGSIPELDKILSASKVKETLSQLSNFDFSTLKDSKLADKMTGLMNKNINSLSGIKLIVPDQIRNAIGGAKEIDLMGSLNSPEFMAYRKQGIGAFAKMSPIEQQRALTGNVALSILEQDSGSFGQVTGQMGTGTKRLGALRNYDKLRNLIRGSTTMRNIGKVAGGVLSFIDPLLVGMQGFDIAREMGLSKSQSITTGVGMAGALGGGLFAASRMMGKAGFASSLSKIAGIGGGLTVLTTGLELYKQKVQSDRKIQEQESSYMGNLGNINFDGIDKSALMKAGNVVMSNDKLRQRQGFKSMMDNALLKTLLIGGGTAAAVLSGGTLLPLLGLAAAGAGVSQTGSDYFSGKSKMTTESKGFHGLTKSFTGGAEFYNRKIQDFDNDIANLSYKEGAGSGLTSAEQVKLVTTRKLREDAIRNRNVQLRSINTIADIYGTEDTGNITGFRDEKLSSSFRLINYLSKEKSKRGNISEYLGAAAVSSQASQNLNEVMQEGVKKNDFSKIRDSVMSSAKINNAMTTRFENALKDVDFNDSNQVQTVLQAEMGRLNSLVAPLGNKLGMQLYKDTNKDSLIRSKMFAQIRSSLGTTKNERNLYSTIEMETSRKLAEIGIDDPYDTLGISKDDYFKSKGIATSKNIMDNLSQSTSSKLNKMGISNIGQLDQDYMNINEITGLPERKTGFELAKDSGKFSNREISQIEQLKGNKERARVAETEYNSLQIEGFRGFINAITDNDQSFNRIKRQQSIYEGMDLSNLSKGKRQEVEFAMKRRASSVKDMRGDELTNIAQEKFGKDVSLKDLSGNQLLELSQDKDVKDANIFEKMKLASTEFEKSSLALGRVFETTSQTVGKQFNFSLEKAGQAVRTFSAGMTTAGDFSNKTMNFVDTLNNSIETLNLTGKSKKLGAEKDLESMKTDEITNKALDLAKVTSASDLLTKDDKGLTGLDRLRQGGILSDEQYGKMSKLSADYTRGEKDILQSRTMGLTAATQLGSLAFQSSSVGGDDFKRVANSMLGINYEQRERLRESSSKELRSAFQGYLSAETPEGKEKQSQFIDQNIASQRKLGLNDYQVRAGIQQYAGGDAGMYDDVTKERVDKLISRTNSNPMLSLLTGSESKANQFKTDMLGYGTVIGKDGSSVTFNEQHSKLSGDVTPVINEMGNVINKSIGVEKISSAVNDFKQVSSNQFDNISRQSEITSTAITSAVIDSDVNKNLTQKTEPVENLQIDTGSRTTDTIAAANNAAALEGLVNKSPAIVPPSNEESFIVMP